METDVPTIVAEIAAPAELQSVVAVITQFKILRFIACNVCGGPAAMVGVSAWALGVANPWLRPRIITADERSFKGGRHCCASRSRT